MIDQKSGHIINIGSTAGKQVYQKGNVYCATKHAVQAISESMRIDLLQHKIKITVIHPGAAETEFSLVRLKQDVQEAKKVYEGYEPLHAEDIANIVYYAASLPAHVCINELEVTCLAQANAYYLFKDPCVRRLTDDSWRLASWRVCLTAFKPHASQPQLTSSVVAPPFQPVKF